MRTVSWVRWATCALTLSITLPVAADHSHRSLAACTSFDQTDRGDDKVAFTIHNACSIPVDCSLSWRVTCAPDSRKRRASHPAAVKLAILGGDSQSAEASAALCGDDAWTIDSVQWSCQPNKD